MISRPTGLLLNLAHSLDHMFLLIFATAVATIATEFGFADWESLMPYSVGAFALFGLGSLPSGRLGDLWGRRRMMLVFFFGMGASALLVAITQNAWQLAGALTLLGAFSSIYHPVGIPMLLRTAKRPGFTIGVNGLFGNMGVALSAVTTGFLVKYIGWRAAFVVPALVCMAAGLLFMRVTPPESEAPAHRQKTLQHGMDRRSVARILMVMTAAAISSSLLFNFTTNGNGQLLRERFVGIIEDPAALGTLLAAIYVMASFAQIIVGSLIDRVPLKQLYLAIVALQAPLFIAAANATGWTLFVLQTAFMLTIFGAIPFTDALVVRYVDDRMRSRVTGLRLAVSFSVSSAAVFLLGPLVKSGGFNTLLVAMAAIAVVTLGIVMLLPRQAPQGRPVTTTLGKEMPRSPAAD